MKDAIITVALLALVLFQASFCAKHFGTPGGGGAYEDDYRTRGR